MFTGIVAEQGRSRPIDDRRRRRRACGSAPGLASELATGRLGLGQRRLPDRDRAPATASFEADVMKQTLELTTLGGLAEGDAVNLELALRADDRLGGHVVQGHVDGTAVLVSADRRRVRPPAALRAARRAAALRRRARLDRDRGSQPHGRGRRVPAARDWLEVSLIPETLERTTLGGLGAGDERQRRVRRAGPLRAAHASEPARRVNIHDRRSERMTKAGRRTRGRPTRRSRRSRRRSRTSAAGGWSSSATTRTARTRAT